MPTEPGQSEEAQGWMFLLGTVVGATLGTLLLPGARRASARALRKLSTCRGRRGGRVLPAGIVDPLRPADDLS